MRLTALAYVFVVATALQPAQATPPTDTRVISLQLIADTNAVSADKPFHIAVQLSNIDSNDMFVLYSGSWVSSWSSSRVELDGPDEFVIETPRWPTPARVDVKGMGGMFGYTGETLVAAKVVPPETLAGVSEVTFSAAVSYYACSNKACSAGRETLTLKIPIASAAKPINQEQFRVWENSLPIPADSPSSSFTVAISGKLTIKPNSTLVEPGKFNIVLSWREDAPKHHWVPYLSRWLIVDNIEQHYAKKKTEVSFRVKPRSVSQLGGRFLQSVVVLEDANATSVSIPILLWEHKREELRSRHVR